MDGTEALAGPATSATVAPQAAAPIEATATPSTGTVAAAPAPAAYQAPPREAMPHREGMVGILDAIGDFLSGGGTQQKITYDENGKHTTETPMTTGQKIAKIGLTALTGAARGMAAPPGPSHVSQGIAAGTLGAISDQEYAADKQDATAQQAFQQKQKAKMDNVNYLLGVRNIATADLTLKAMGVKATNEQIESSNKMIDRERTLESYDLGMAANAGEIADRISKLPGWEQELYKHENVQAIPVYGAGGERIGLQLYLRKPNTDQQAAAQGATALKFVPPSKPGEQPTMQSFTPAGATNGDIDKYNRAAQTQFLTWQKDQADAELKKSEAGKNDATATEAPSVIGKNKAEANRANAEAAKALADAGHARAQTKVLNEATDAGAIQNNAQQLLEGTIDPANLSKRSKSYDATLAMANALSFQQTGHSFDLAKAASDYKYATNASTQSTLKFLNSLVGHDNNGGNLATLVELSNKLKQTNFPALNNVEQWAKLESGNPQVAAYRFALTETADQFAKILQGGGAGGATSDAKIKQGLELFNKGFSGKQMAEVASTGRILLGNRKSEMVGDNRYLTRWQGGIQGQAAPQATPQTAQQPNPNAPDASFAGAPKPGESVAHGPNGTAVFRNGAWRDITTGSRVQ